MAALPAWAQGPTPKAGDVPLMSFKQLFDAAANPLAWRKIAGQTVGVYGGQFFNIARIDNAQPETWLISLRSNQYSIDILSCGVSPDSLDTASSFKPNDPVSIVGKLAGSPHDRRPAFEGSCFVASGKRAPSTASEPAADAGPHKTDFSSTIQQYVADTARNPVAVQQKYNEKTVEITGGKVGDIKEKYFEVTTQVGNPGFQREAPEVNCFVAPAAAANIANLSKGQTVTVTGAYKRGDFMRTTNPGAILESCTFK